MAPLFQRRSLLIRDDEPDYSVRARYSHGTSDGGMGLTPPPVRIYSPPPKPVPPLSPPASAPSRLKTGLEGLTVHARGLSRQLADASRSRIANIAGRLAKTLTDTDQPVVAFAGTPPGQSEVAMLAEERRWRDYEAAHRADLSDSVSGPHEHAVHEPEPPARLDDPASELLRMRAERILTEAERVEMEPHPPMESPPEEEESSPRQMADCSTPEAEMSPRGAGRGKYGVLMDQVGDQTPQNWETTPEEPPMQEEHTNGTHVEPRTSSVKLDSDSNTIDITRESRFSGQLKFSGTLVIEGEVEGELEATRVIIREGGIASARILGDSITISGKVNGDVVARRALEMTSTGRLQGDVTAPEMKLHPGSVVKGRCSIGEAA